MSHYALVNEENIVYDVAFFHESVEETDIESYFESKNIKAIKTSYNTKNNMHYIYDEESKKFIENPSGSLRKNYASVGFTYNEELDAFIPPKPYNSWILDEDKGDWNPPVSFPEDGLNGDKKYIWSEENLEWVEITE